jgi:hypothetical protein
MLDLSAAFSGHLPGTVGGLPDPLSSQAPKSHIGAPKARGLTAKERSSTNIVGGLSGFSLVPFFFLHSNSSAQATMRSLSSKAALSSF